MWKRWSGSHGWYGGDKLEEVEISGQMEGESESDLKWMSGKWRTGDKEEGGGEAWRIRDTKWRLWWCSGGGCGEEMEEEDEQGEDDMRLKKRGSGDDDEGWKEEVEKVKTMWRR